MVKISSKGICRKQGSEETATKTSAELAEVKELETRKKKKKPLAGNNEPGRRRSDQQGNQTSKKEQGNARQSDRSRTMHPTRSRLPKRKKSTLRGEKGQGVQIDVTKGHGSLERPKNLGIEAIGQAKVCLRIRNS